VQAELKVQQTQQLLPRIHQLQEELKEAHSKVESLPAKLLQEESGNLFNETEEVEGITFVSVVQENQSADGLRQLGDVWREKQASNILVAVSNQDDKATLLVFVDDETVAKGTKAGDIIKPLAKLIGEIGRASSREREKMLVEARKVKKQNKGRSEVKSKT